MELHDFSAIRVKEIAPGVRGRYAHSAEITEGIVDLAQGAVVPDHSHPHEQWTMVMTGALELTVGGTLHILTPGKVLYIAPHERHSAVARVPCQVFDVFHPVRTDYR